MQPAMVHPEVLQWRRKSGTDLFDEVWDGVLHMVPPPTLHHQHFGARLLRALGPVADRLGLLAVYETGLFEPDADPQNYRIPDVMITRPEHGTDRGIEGPAELVVELLSPNDESRDKLPFYAQMGAREVWIIDPETRAFEVYATVDGESVRVDEPTVLGVALTLVEGPKLRVVVDGIVTEI